MAQSIVTTIEQVVQMEDIMDIIYTETLLDVDGKWVREFRFFGTPANDGSNIVRTFVVRVRSADKDNLNLTTVPLQI